MEFIESSLDGWPAIEFEVDSPLGGTRILHALESLYEISLVPNLYDMDGEAVTIDFEFSGSAAQLCVQDWGVSYLAFVDVDVRNHVLATLLDLPPNYFS